METELEVRPPRPPLGLSHVTRGPRQVAPGWVICPSEPRPIKRQNGAESTVRDGAHCSAHDPCLLSCLEP